jgi:ubiquinone/menaquinone biosynthesis C-methylase UbiE
MSAAMTQPTVAAVRDFWNANPLFVGEAALDEDFFAKHNAVYYVDVLAGVNLEKAFAMPAAEDFTLDVGCGIGFWTKLFHDRGVKSVHACDLSPVSLALAKQRLGGASNVTFSEENAEALSFPSDHFDHVNCQGVIHHTPNTQAAMNEIYRVLKLSGKASVSVYYKNWILRNFALIKEPVSWLMRRLGRDMGRGRDFARALDEQEIVRLYDGADNPVGRAYSKDEFLAICNAAGFKEITLAFYFFPARFLKIPGLRLLAPVLVRVLPFMIIANCKK